MLAPFIALWLDAAILGQAAPLASALHAAPAAVAPADESPLFNFDFPGGTLRAYVAALQKVTPNVNLVVPNEAADLPMPQLSLKQIDLLTALTLIEGQQQGPSGTTTVQLEAVNGGESEAMRTYRVQVNGPPAARTANDVVIESLADIIAAGVNANAAISAIEAGTTVALGDRAATMEISFHEPTSLLMARGPTDGCAAAVRVVNSLRTAARPTKSALEAQLQERLSQMQRDSDEMVSRARREMEVQVVEARVKTAEMQAALEATKATADRERARADGLEESLRKRLAELNATNARLADLELRAKNPK